MHLQFPINLLATDWHRPALLKTDGGRVMQLFNSRDVAARALVGYRRFDFLILTFASATNFLGWFNTTKPKGTFTVYVNEKIDGPNQIKWTDRLSLEELMGYLQIAADREANAANN